MNAATTPTLTPEAAVVSDDEASIEEQQKVDRVEPLSVQAASMVNRQKDHGEPRLSQHPLVAVSRLIQVTASPLTN